MNLPFAPKVAKLLQEVHRVPAGFLIIVVYCLTQVGKRLMPAMMTYFILQRFPHPFLRILFWGVSREVDHPNPPMPLQPFFHFIARMMSGIVYPQQDRAAPMLLLNHLQPTDRRFAVLPIDDESGRLLARPQMH